VWQSLGGRLTLRVVCRAGGTITAAELVRQIRLVGKNKAFSGLILRVDSPGLLASAYPSMDIHLISGM